MSGGNQSGSSGGSGSGGGSGSSGGGGSGGAGDGSGSFSGDPKGNTFLRLDLVVIGTTHILPPAPNQPSTIWFISDSARCERETRRLISLDQGTTPGEDPTFFAQSYKKDVARGRLEDWSHLHTTVTRTFNENDVRQIDWAIEYLGQGNRSEWDLNYEGRGWDYAVSFEPNPSASGGMYDVHEQYQQYVTTNVGQASVIGGGVLTFRRVPASGENTPAPYELETSGAWVVTTQAQGDATADGFGYVLHRTFSAPQYVPNSMSTGALLGFGANGQPLENPGGGAGTFL